MFITIQNEAITLTVDTLGADIVETTGSRK